MLPCIISQDIVEYLHAIKGFSIEEIADITSIKVKDVEQIRKGLRTFSSNNLKSLETKQTMSLIAIILESCPEKHLPDKLLKNVSLYKHLQKVKSKIKNNT